MIAGSDVYNVFTAMVPLYVAMALGYASVRWWNAFTVDECSGINRFVAFFAVPFLAFRMIATNDPYAMNLRFLAADTLQKVVTLVALSAWAWACPRASPTWIPTLFSLSNLPNTIILGVPLLGGMYGASASYGLMAQAVVFQLIVWFNLVLFLYEYNAAVSAAMEVGDVKVEDVSIPHQNGDMELGDVSNSRPNGDAKSGASTRTILSIVLRKLIKNPNVYAGILGLIWSLIAFRRNIKMPAIVDGSISVISVSGIGLAMFSLGTFMAREPKFISCGKSIAALAMAVKFILSPGTMALCSLVIGLRGLLLHISIVQAALPLAVLSFVYAKEYNVHPDIMSTGVILGMFIAIPTTLLYYVLLELM